MRVDFNYTNVANLADMFLRFDSGNAWADSLRIEVTKISRPVRWGRCLLLVA